MMKLITKIIKGAGRGKSIGFPTINLDFKDKTIPGEGIYAVKCIYKDKKYKGIANIGNNPTFEDKGFSIEVHLFDFNEDITDDEITVDFLDKIRDEEKFDTINSLTAQIAKDIEKAKEYFK